ncbi:uncharacterized protein EV420DRAFT_1767432 [Desarmillaria tabescens]|uniref:Uncharacterized protein n=1 Tax=Armillaria tabescens TaxID=1929756 RepID=A0AA39MVZ1_ARMTA|nr:uncharacterized protein EV420DRAFT_1767432 [Desarmillaria tabescens]KAK0447845.1 hypothetical protein EV420DRAFT_1767432 [Desarmillaria tabescens]
MVQPENAFTEDFMSSHWQDAGAASEECLPTMHDALDGLRDMEDSVFHSTNYLITQVAICTPFQEKATLTIFEPLRDAVVDFLIPVIEAWLDILPVISYFASLLEEPAPPASWIVQNYHSMRLNAQSARGHLALLEATIVSVQAALVDHLRGSCGLEPLLRTLKWLGTSSTRVDILDNLPQLFLEFRTYCWRTTRCLDIIEHFIVGLHDFFSDEGSVRALTGREEICRKLYDLCRFATESMLYAPSHPSSLGLKGSKVLVRLEYKARRHLREDSAFSQIIH